MSEEIKAITLCPLCGGQGTVSKPPWVDGDIHQWVSGSSGGYTCKVCGGKGYICI